MLFTVASFPLPVSPKPIAGGKSLTNQIIAFIVSRTYHNRTSSSDKKPKYTVPAVDQYLLRKMHIAQCFALSSRSHMPKASSAGTSAACYFLIAPVSAGKDLKRGLQFFIVTFPCKRLPFEYSLNTQVFVFGS